MRPDSTLGENCHTALRTKRLKRHLRLTLPAPDGLEEVGFGAVTVEQPAALIRRDPASFDIPEYGRLRCAGVDLPFDLIQHRRESGTDLAVFFARRDA